MTASLSLCLSRSGSDVTELVEAHIPLATRLARERAASLPTHVNLEDLRSAALMALVVSAQNFDPERGVPFVHFAAIRIRGALKDELRGMDWATRTVRARSREAESVRGHLTAVLDRSPREEEIAEAMQVTVHELNSLNADVARARVLSLQSLSESADVDIPDDPCDSPESVLLRRERLGYLHDAITELPVRLRIVVRGYFFDERQMSDIAVELGVTQSRVSQLCSEALSMLREGLNSQLETSTLSDGPRSERSCARRAAYAKAISVRSTVRGRLDKTTILGDTPSVFPATRVRVTRIISA
jgi:RNA polymerase sigma factor for flagellar operon FliA